MRLIGRHIVLYLDQQLLVVEILDLVSEFGTVLGSQCFEVTAVRHLQLWAVCTLECVLVETAAGDVASLTGLRG